MKNKTTGLLLIGMSLLAIAICYGLERVTKMISIAARYMKDDNVLVRISVSIPIYSLIFILLTMGIGIYLTTKPEK